MSDLGKRIEAARLHLGLTQAELGEKLHLTQQAINRIESGLTKNPRNLPAIAKALNVEVSFLLTGEINYIDSYVVDNGTSPSTGSILELISMLTTSQKEAAIKFMEGFRATNEAVFDELGDKMMKRKHNDNARISSDNHAHA